ncbi:MAG: carboxylesterase family protein [Pseudohongiellaceae bacterium]
MKLLRSFLISMLTVFSLSFAGLAGAVDEPVQITAGLITGKTLDSDVQAFLGIPYAAPPVGDLRWKAPEPALPWNGIRASDRHGAACMQRRDNIYMSEDCLFVNVWTGAESDDKLPVMVWIHGGGWNSHSNGHPTYDGEAFADNGVVLVSVNYRLGAFGWMAHPELSAESGRGVSGNYGVLDHLLALQWVQDNIEQFGGDKDNVTIFGESAGGASIYALLATPMAKGLFHKAISESTWITASNVTNLKTPNGLSESAEDRGAAAIAAKLRDLDIDGPATAATMRALPASTVLDLDHRLSLVVDGWLYPKAPMDIFQEGSHNVVPLLAGINDGEGLLYTRPDNVPESIAAQRQLRLDEFGADYSALVDIYTAEGVDGIFDMEVDFRTDTSFGRGTRELVHAMARSTADSYMYVFTRNLRNPDERSPHFMEVQYVFNNLDDSVSQTDKDIARLMNDYWVQFAATGSPNGDGLPNWPVYDLETRTQQLIGAEVGPGSLIRSTHLDTLDHYLRERYDSVK